MYECSLHMQLEGIFAFVRKNSIYDFDACVDFNASFGKMTAQTSDRYNQSESPRGKGGGCHVMSCQNKTC